MSRPVFISSLIAATLALLMLATRTHHFASSLNLPDASLAVFFLAGRYLERRGWLTPLLALTLAIDYVAITLMGVSDFCVSPAYGFLLPAYAALWYAGRITRKNIKANVKTLARTTGAAGFATVLAFALTNGSFYWLSGRIAAPNVQDYLQNAALYFYPYFSTPWIWLAAAALVESALRMAAFARKARHT